MLTFFLLLNVVLIIYDHSFAYEFISLSKPETLALIISLMVVAKLVEESGYLTRLSDILITSLNSSVFSLVITSIASGLLASIIMNDAALFFAVPLAISIATRSGINRFKAAAVVTAGVNIGSALTPIGNPQNILIWKHFGIGFLDFVTGMLPYVAASMALLTTYSFLIMRKHNRGLSPPPPVLARVDMLVAGIALLILNVAMAIFGMIFYALVITLVVATVVQYELVLNLDLPLVFSFMLMFASLSKISELIPAGVASLWTSTPLSIYLFSAGLSQAISNVPAAIVLEDHVSNWLPLAVGVNIGGCGLIIGSLANIITLRLVGGGIKELHKYMIPLFLMLLLLNALLMIII